MPEGSCGSPRGGLKSQGRTDGIWDAAHMWVWITPSFLPLQERSPCPFPQATGMLSGLILEVSLVVIKLNQVAMYIQPLCRWFQAGMGFCTAPGCCLEVVRDQARVQSCHGECAKCCCNPAGDEHRIAPAQQPDP